MLELLHMDPKAHDTQPQASEVRKGPWSMEEDLALTNYIASHGEGVWNNLARSAGLKRTGKSCRLRWLNYLRPDVRRGNITPEEEHLITDLHSRWGNRWSKIAKQMPGRTDNEIKNFWRTRIQKKNRTLAPNHDEGPGLQVDVSTSTADTNDANPTNGGSVFTPYQSTYNVYQPLDFYTSEDPIMATPSFPESTGGLWSADDFWSMEFFSGESSD